MKNILVKKFCTPPFVEITNFDIKSLSKAKRNNLDFERNQIPIYSWGEGKKILLVHGWGSRASHMSLIARILTGDGFNVFSFDAPAHSSENNVPLESTLNMFEFGRCISAVANQIGDLHAIVAHSFGGTATFFSMNGFMKLKGYEFEVKKLVLISSPSNIGEMILSYSKTHNLTESDKILLQEGVEEEFEFEMDDYFVNKVFKSIETDIMVVHDKEDEEVPISTVSAYKDLQSKVEFIFTNGLGHRKILFNRDLIKTISNFIKSVE